MREASKALAFKIRRWISDPHGPDEDLDQQLAEIIDEEMIKQYPINPEWVACLEKDLDDAILERDACHRCWDDFVTKISDYFPSMRNAPMFQMADDILTALRHRDKLEKLARERGEAEIRLKLALEEILEKADAYPHQVHWCRETARKALLMLR